MRTTNARSAMAIMLPACLLYGTQAQAHFVLLYPPSRGVALEVAPCGAAGSTRGSTVTVLRPGQTIVVQWNVQVDHLEPPKFRIAFDDAGQDFPTPTGGADAASLPLFVDGILTPGGGLQTKTIALPNMECDNCTLQMLQYLSPKPPYAPGNFYYQCADITLSASAPEPALAAMRDAGSDADSDAAAEPPFDTADARGAQQTDARQADAQPPPQTTGDDAGPRPDAGAASVAAGAAGCRLGNGARGDPWALVMVAGLLAQARARRDSYSEPSDGFRTSRKPPRARGQARGPRFGLARAELELPQRATHERRPR